MNNSTIMVGLPLKSGETLTAPLGSFYVISGVLYFFGMDPANFWVLADDVNVVGRSNTALDAYTRVATRAAQESGS